MRIVSALFVLFVVTACGSNDSPPQPAPTTCPVSASATAPSARTATTSSSTLTGDREAGVAYMCSLERLKAYDEEWSAAEKVARAILDGKFGTFESLMPDKATAVASNYTGQGGLYALNKNAYAYVWWQNGQVDFSKEISSFSLYGLQLHKGSGDTLYTVTVPDTGYTWVMSPNYFGAMSPEGVNRYPVSAWEAKSLDDTAHRKLRDGLKAAGL